MRTVVVTGVSRGLGLAIAERLAGDGWRVVGAGRTLSDDYAALMARHPETALFETLDVADLGQIPEAARKLIAAHKPIWGLVNNAALGTDGVLGTMHHSDIDRVMRTNLLGPILLTKHLSRSMLSRREGRIVNITSIIASTGFSGLSVYGASKAGMEGFTRSLSRELGKAGVTVNCVAPGYMETEMTRALQGDRLESIRRRAPLGLARVADAAAAVAWLLGPDAERVTGTVLTVDGGSTA